jgi:fumarate reductase subunit D
MEIIAVLSLVVSLAANIPYIIEIVQGKAKPERISWLLWTILGAVYFFSTIFDTGATLFTLGELIAPVIILILAFKYGVGGKSRFDLISLAVALIALAILFSTTHVLLSLLLALFVDGIGAMLTIRKLRIDPTSESRAFWGLTAIAGVLAVISLEEFTVNALLFPVYVGLLSAYIFLVSKPAAKQHIEAIEKL